MTNENTNTTIIELEEMLTMAERKGNREQLSLLLSDEFQGINIRGAVVNKEEFIALHCSPHIKFNGLCIENLHIRAVGTVQVVIGRSVFEVEIGKQVIHSSAHFMNCWNNASGAWKLEASSVTREQKV